MNRMGTWLAAGLLLVLAATLLAQLPPEIELDRHLLQLKQQVAEADFSKTSKVVRRIEELQREHGLEFPQEYSLMVVQAWLGIGDPVFAIKSVTRYLTATGREGEHYHKALELLDKAELALAATEAAANAAAEAANRRPGKPQVFDGMEFVWVPAGEFLLGSTSSEADPDELPITLVRISRGYWLGKHEVTQSEWQALMGTNPSKFADCGRCPVEGVSWYDVQDFMNLLNLRVGATSYRLPTEAEWEYAARAGTTGDRYYEEDINAIAWYGGIRENSQLVGRKDPNAWGLHDMLGNVNEWVQDWYGDYPGGTVADPQGPRFGSKRVFRGGSWWYYAKGSRASSRANNPPAEAGSLVGFRLLRMHYAEETK